MINEENIAKDYYYSKLLKEHTEQYVIRAGYFENETKDNCLSDEELMETMKVPCTALKSIEEYQKPGACILLTTGCFNPIHIDHLAMLYEAKSKLSALGHRVVQTVISPDSDSYCATKGDYYPFFHRVEKIMNLVRDYKEDIDVDLFPSLFNLDLNFTTIYRRLELYIEHFTGVKVPIYYVCGSDRAEFSFAFDGKSIVVQREGYGNPRHPYSITVTPGVPLTHSSTQERKRGLTHAEKSDVIIRHDTKYPQDIFEKYYKSIHNHNTKIPLGQDTISLDSMTRLENNLQISRAFSFGGMRQLGFTNRPGSLPFVNQLENIPVGKYWLFDDDILGGATVKYATDLLESVGFDILGYKTLFQSNKKFEVLDARDFEFGSNSGLCIRFPDGEEYRVPYLYPFVNLWERASIRKPIEFSKEIWNHIGSYQSNLTIDRGVRGKLYLKLGFDPNTTFKEIAQYYENICKQAL